MQQRTQLQAVQTSISSSSPPFLLHLPWGCRVEGHSSGDLSFRPSWIRGQYAPILHFSSLDPLMLPPALLSLTSVDPRLLT